MEGVGIFSTPFSFKFKEYLRDSQLIFGCFFRIMLKQREEFTT